MAELLEIKPKSETALGKVQHADRTKVDINTTTLIHKIKELAPSILQRNESIQPTAITARTARSSDPQAPVDSRESLATKQAEKQDSFEIGEGNTADLEPNAESATEESTATRTCAVPKATNQTLGDFIKSAQESLEREFAAFCEAPLKYTSEAVSNFVKAPFSSIGRCCAKLCEFIVTIPQLIVESFKELAAQRAERILAGESSQQSEGLAPRSASGIFPWLKDTFLGANSTATAQQPTSCTAESSNQDDEYYEKLEKKKTFWDNLAESLLTLATAIGLRELEKKEDAHFEDPAEHKERLEEAARKEMETAKSLRPDLERYIHRPQTDCIFSCIGEIPDADALIAQAEHDEAADSLLNQLARES